MPTRTCNLCNHYDAESLSLFHGRKGLCSEQSEAVFQESQISADVIVRGDADASHCDYFDPTEDYFAIEQEILAQDDVATAGVDYPATLGVSVKEWRLGV